MTDSKGKKGILKTDTENIINNLSKEMGLNKTPEKEAVQKDKPDTARPLEKEKDPGPRAEKFQLKAEEAGPSDIKKETKPAPAKESPSKDLGAKDLGVEPTEGLPEDEDLLALQKKPIGKIIFYGVIGCLVVGLLLFVISAVKKGAFDLGGKQRRAEKLKLDRDKKIRDLTPVYGMLKLSSVPDRAKIYINGEQYLAEFEGKKLPAATNATISIDTKITHTIKLLKEDYLPTEFTLKTEDWMKLGENAFSYAKQVVLEPTAEKLKEMEAEKDQKIKLRNRVEWLGQSGVIIKTTTKLIYIDPYQVKGAKKGDLILITHDHPDHCSPEDVKNLSKSDTIIVTTPGCKEKLIGDVRTLKPGGKLKIDDVEIEAVPAYNLKTEYHPKEKGYLGFILTIDDERIYHAGDTDAVPEIQKIKADVVFVPVGGTDTMNAEEAADFVNTIKPKKLAVPIHFGGKVGKIEDAKLFKKLVKVRVKIFEKPEF